MQLNVLKLKYYGQ